MGLEELQRPVLAVIGSTALNFWFPQHSTPHDLDLVGPYDEVAEYAKKNGFADGQIHPTKGGDKIVYRGKTKILEADITWPGSSAEDLYNLISDDCKTQSGALLVPHIDVLYLLKLSHRYLKNSPHFLKTMHDIKLMRRLGAKIRPEHEAFYRRRMEATYNYKHPSLMQNKDSFFNGDGVQYVYDHDSIHEAVAAPLAPAYRLYAADGEEVLSSRKKFFAAPQELRIRGVREEAMVLALERSLIPFPGKMTPVQAYKFALMKVCTSITSGWFREFAWEHYDDALKIDVNYANKFFEAAKAGKVRPYEHRNAA